MKSWNTISYCCCLRLLSPYHQHFLFFFVKIRWLIHYIWEAILLLNAHWVSQLVLYQVLNAVNDSLFKENVWSRNYISFEKDTKKIVLLQVKGWAQIISKFRARKILYTLLLSTKDPFWEVQIEHQNNYVAKLNTLKRNELNVYISLLQENKLAFFANTEGLSQRHGLVHDFWKNN